MSPYHICDTEGMNAVGEVKITRQKKLSTASVGSGTMDGKRIEKDSASLVLYIDGYRIDLDI